MKKESRREDINSLACLNQHLIQMFTGRTYFSGGHIIRRTTWNL